jgi:hypothetical protein
VNASELQQFSAPGKTMFVIYQVSWLVLDQWTFRFEADLQNNLGIVLRKKSVTRLFALVKIGES